MAIEIEELNAVIAKPTKAPIAAEMAIFRHFGEIGISEICFLFAPAEDFIVGLNGMPIVELSLNLIFEPSSIPSAHPNLIANLDENPNVYPCAQTALDVASNLGRGYNFASRDPK